MPKANEPDDEPIETTAEESESDSDSSDAPAVGVGGRVRRPGGTVRIAGFLLMGLGVLLAALSGPAVFDPPGSRCALARTLIDDANDDKKDFNNVDIGDAKDADDLDCAQANRLAQRIPEKEDRKDFKDLPTEGAVRTQGIISSFIGIGQALSGGILARTFHRRARTFAVSFAVLGLVFPLLGLISLGAMAFVLYALLFSPDSKALYGATSGFGGLFRPRPRAGADDADDVDDAEDDDDR